MNSVYDDTKGDKILVRRGEYQGRRGIIDDVQGNIVRVVFPDGEATLSNSSLQNFSSAARKAWRKRRSQITDS